MKFPALRRYIRATNQPTPHSLEKCEVIIDGDSFFRDTYRNSGCQYILGPNCDTYADFLRKQLEIFEDKDKCYVIFSGATKHDIDKRKEIHQRIIDDITIQRNMVGYYEPLFVKDVQKEVLNELNIKYFVCEYDSIGAIVGLARKLQLPVLTNNIEYSCFGVSCITQNSVEYDRSTMKLNCTIYEHENVKTAVGVYNKMPILLALLHKSGDSEKLAEVIEDGDCNVKSVIRYVKRQKEATIIDTVSRCADQNKTIMDVYEKIQHLYFYPNSNLVVKHFERGGHELIRDDKKWFTKAVSSGKIGLPYINLKIKGVICGSLIMNDNTRPDALLAAIDIIAYSHCLLKNSQDSTITFLGRTGNKSSVEEIKTHWDNRISNRNIFTKHRVGKKLRETSKKSEIFDQFLEVFLPGVDFHKLLEIVPCGCKMLIISLVYYVFTKNKDFIKGAYCVLLSYVMLSPVFGLFDLILHKLSNTEDDRAQFYNELQFLFDKVNLKQKFNSKVVHDFSEFQHCLQHMNYLNKLCGENFASTVYKDTYNATFIYNTFLFKETKYELMQFLENKFAGSRRLTMYKKIVNAFENCLSVVNKSE